MNEEQLETINIIQETLRGLMIAITAQPNVDLSKLAIALQAASGNEAISPMARQMLANLAELPDMLAKVKRPPH